MLVAVRTEWECVDHNEGEKNTQDEGRGQCEANTQKRREQDEMRTLAMMVAAEVFFIFHADARRMDEFSMRFASKVRRYSWEIISSHVVYLYRAEAFFFCSVLVLFHSFS